MLIVGFGHRARQGKNTAALELLKWVPVDTVARMYAFADALKLEVRKASFQMGGEAQLIESFKEAGLMPDWVIPEAPKPRSLLQWWGTDYRRAKDPDYWVRELDKTLTKHAPDIAVITDVRFRNEAEYIKSKGGLLVKVQRTSKPDFKVQEHASEAELDHYAGWDYTLTAATVEELRLKARQLWAEIEAKCTANTKC